VEHVVGEVSGEHVKELGVFETVDHVEPFAEDDSGGRRLVKREADDHVRLVRRALPELVRFHLGPGEKEAVAFLAGIEV
jgi:hypothetical protein